MDGFYHKGAVRRVLRTERICKLLISGSQHTDAVQGQCNAVLRILFLKVRMLY